MTKEQTDRQTEGQTDRRTEGQTTKRTDRQKDKQTYTNSQGIALLLEMFEEERRHNNIFSIGYISKCLYFKYFVHNVRNKSYPLFANRQTDIHTLILKSS